MSQEAPCNLVDETLGRRVALRLRAEGLSYKDIAAEMGVSQQTAHNWVTAELKVAQHETAESVAQLRELEALRLDRMLRKWLPKAEEGDAEAAGVILRIMDRRAKMFGIDAPTKTAAINMTSDINPLLLEAEARRMGIPLVEPKEVPALTCQVTTILNDDSKSDERLPRCGPERDCSTTSDTSLSTAAQSPDGSPTLLETGSGSLPDPMPLDSIGLPGFVLSPEDRQRVSGLLSREDTTRPGPSDEPSTSS